MAKTPGRHGKHHGAPSRPPEKRANAQLDRQLRKVLGKHYANRYRTGRKRG